MANEAKNSPAEKFGSLRECLVDGDAEQVQREGRLRRRAMAISLMAQAAVLAAVMLVPLFYPSDRIAVARVVPSPPFRGGVRVVNRPQPPRQEHDHFSVQHGPCYFCPKGATKPLTHSTVGQSQVNEPPGDPFPGFGEITGDPSLPGIGTQSQPQKPPERPQQRPHQRLHVATLKQAMLLRRVEPLYPAIAQQLRLSGHVELHAIIATDGTIQSLQAVSGNPMFFQSAMDAVRQWRYRPTILNGQAVEVETVITVNYQVQ